MRLTMKWLGILRTLPLMCQIPITVFVLALASLPAAGGSSVFPEKARTHASVTVVSHRMRRPTPEEVGRAAGLKIRRELALQRQRDLVRRDEGEPAGSHETFVPETSGRRAPLQGRESTLRRARAEGQAEASAPQFVRTRLLAPAPPLRGSLASLERQNERLDADGLERIEDETDLSSRIAHKLLVPVPVSADLTVNSDLPEHHRYCRPWTARFLADLARMHATLFHRPLEVSSAVRTVEYQEHLRLINGNAAPAEGDIVSPHLTGAAVDIAKKGLSQQEISWMRRWLLPLEIAGKIDVEEEFEQACFHVTVYRNYVPSRPLERFRFTHQHREDVEGGFFLRKKPLSRMDSVGSRSETAVARPGRAKSRSDSSARSKPGSDQPSEPGSAAKPAQSAFAG